MKIAIYGAGGILGQTMRLYQPSGWDVRYYRRKADLLHYGIDLTSSGPDEFRPDVIVNFAGENRPDIVEKAPKDFYAINVSVPAKLAEWCDQNGKHYLHISTQGIFSGNESPYGPQSPVFPINAYGRQKAKAETYVRQYRNWTILRPTFVLGIRPLPHVGRQNPMEQMLENLESKQVDNRRFSPLFARQAAKTMWPIIKSRPKGQILHLGEPVSVSRYDISTAAGCKPFPVPHEFFSGFAPRPRDTHYSGDSIASIGLDKGLGDCKADFASRFSSDLAERAQELALFFHISEAEAGQKLQQGFSALHNEVARDFRRANPQNDTDLLEWYRGTESYIWELSAYHLDEGFNYPGMCRGIAEHLKGSEGKVLCIGDGIGDLTLHLRENGIRAVYHDLKRSKTAEFARFKLWRRFGEYPDMLLTDDWQPDFNGEKFQIVLCLDFLEHVTDVPAWTGAIKKLLCPGGTAFFQNAFNLGSGQDGSIPMHLARNDRYEKDWVPLMAKVGFRQQGTSNWWEA